VTAADPYARMALGYRPETGRADTLPAAWHAEDVLRAAMDRQAGRRAAARAERHRVRTLTVIKRLLFAVVAGVLMLTAAAGTGAWFMSQAGHVPAVVRLAPERASCAIFVSKC